MAFVERLSHRDQKVASDGFEKRPLLEEQRVRLGPNLWVGPPRRRYPRRCGTPTLGGEPLYREAVQSVASRRLPETAGHGIVSPGCISMFPELTPSGQLTFTQFTSLEAAGPMIQASNGTFYGLGGTFDGSAGLGTVFKFSP
jgi:hypothetical protein